MMEATYRIIQAGTGFKVEVNRPGEMVQLADGFESEADAASWIEEDKRIAELDDRQKPAEPPKLREV